MKNSQPGLRSISEFDKGCVLSPTLFNIYVNDLITALESAEVGVLILKNRVTCLLYADDAALVAEKEADLQVLY